MYLNYLEELLMTIYFALHVALLSVATFLLCGLKCRPKASEPSLQVAMPAVLGCASAFYHQEPIDPDAQPKQ